MAKKTKKKTDTKKAAPKKAKKTSEVTLMAWLKASIEPLKPGASVDFNALEEAAAAAGYENSGNVSRQYIWHVAKAGLVDRVGYGEWVRSGGKKAKKVKTVKGKKAKAAPEKEKTAKKKPTKKAKAAPEKPAKKAKRKASSKA